MLTTEKKDPAVEYYEFREGKSSRGEVELCFNAKGDAIWRAAWWKNQDIKGAFFETKDEAMGYIHGTSTSILIGWGYEKHARN